MRKARKDLVNSFEEERDKLAVSILKHMKEESMERLNKGLQLELDFQALEVAASRLADERTRTAPPQSNPNVSSKSPADGRSRKPARTRTRKEGGQDRRTATSLEDVARTHGTTPAGHETEIIPEDQGSNAE